MSDEYAHLQIERNGHVATVRLSRPEAKNALNVDLLRELTDAATELSNDASINVVILTGTTEYFSAGVDLRAPALVNAMQQPMPLRRRALEIGPRMCRAWEEMAPVTIAAVEGHCVGGAMSLILSCDFVVASQSAFFLIPEIDRGMNYSWGSLRRLTLAVGPAVAKKWVMFAERVAADEAEKAGLITWSSHVGGAYAKAKELAEQLAAKPQMGLLMTKQTVNAFGRTLAPVEHMDGDQFAMTLLSEDFQEGVSAFLEKREPVFNKDLPGSEDE
ncbi:enoyl-CoA hydratase/isomerase family protein [bacterium]|nr:enoyl-CoA hydratase/isomerase family protein [bacterium]